VIFFVVLPWEVLPKGKDQNDIIKQPLLDHRRLKRQGGVAILAQEFAGERRLIWEMLKV